MNQVDVKVAFYLKVNEKNAEGRCPVMGRLTVGRSESVFSAKPSVPASLWSSGRAKGKSAEATAINRQLDEYRASVLAIYREQSAVRERVTTEEVKCLLLGMAAGQETLLDYFRTYIEHFEKRVGVSIGTIREDVSQYLQSCRMFSVGTSTAVGYSIHYVGSVVHRQVRPIPAHRTAFGST